MDPEDADNELVTQSITQCSFKCYLRINEHEQKQIFNDYWKDATYKSRFIFVRNMIEFPTNQAHFYLDTGKSRKEVCRRCFRQILGESNSMISDIVEKKFESLRGKHFFHLQLQVFTKHSNTHYSIFQFFLAMKEKTNTTIPVIIESEVTKQTNPDNRLVGSGIIQNVEHESTKVASLITQDLSLPKLDKKGKGITGQKERKENQQK